MDSKNQIKSRQRVVDHGEVFTSGRDVNDMCDLVSHECTRIDSRFLEPACGDGNFLSEIFKRKLVTVEKLYRKSQYDFERYSLLALTSIYGVDLQQDNVIECRQRLFEIWNNKYQSLFKKDCSSEIRDAATYILSKNILCGNALTLMEVDANCNDTNHPIIFPEWSMLGTKFKRRDFRLDVLLKSNTPVEKKRQMVLSEPTDSVNSYLTHNPVTGEYMPLPIREYPPMLMKQIMNVDKEMQNG